MILEIEKSLSQANCLGPSPGCSQRTGSLIVPRFRLCFQIWDLSFFHVTDFPKWRYFKLRKIILIFKLGVRSPRFAPDVQTISPKNPDEFIFKATWGDFTVHLTHISSFLWPAMTWFLVTFTIIWIVWTTRTYGRWVTRTSSLHSDVYIQWQ